MWSIDPADRVPTIGEIKNVFDSPIKTGPDGLFAQMFLWTGSFGDHFVEFENVEIRLKLRTSPLR
jgi:hypothetical protein